MNTAIYLTNPELFTTSEKRICKVEDNMKTGWMQIDTDGSQDDSMVNVVDMPDKIIDIDTFNELFYDKLSKMK